MQMVTVTHALSVRQITAWRLTSHTIRDNGQPMGVLPDGNVSVKNQASKSY